MIRPLAQLAAILGTAVIILATITSNGHALIASALFTGAALVVLSFADASDRLARMREDQ